MIAHKLSSVVPCQARQRCASPTGMTSLRKSRSLAAKALNHQDVACPVPILPRISAAFCACALLTANSASAAVEQVGEFDASGFLFKDSVEITALDDPNVKGVTLYISDFKRSLTDKLAKDFFSEPSQASLSCAITGPVVIQDSSKLGGEKGAEVFSESRGFNIFKNKTIRLRQVYDPKRNTMLYVAYSTRLTGASDEGNVSSGRYKTSLCAVKLPDNQPAPPL